MLFLADVVRKSDLIIESIVTAIDCLFSTGSVIKIITKSTGTNIAVIRGYLQKTGGLPEKPVVINGTLQKCSLACRQILEIIMSESKHLNGVFLDPSKACLKMLVPTAIVGRIIGKSGAFIRYVMAATETKIHNANYADVIEEQFGIVRDNWMVSIRGSVEEIPLR